MANSNIINAVFGSGICAVTTSAFRANYGMVLRFSGIDLPTAFECDFSNYDVMGRDSITAIGQNNEVQIPDDLWDSGLNIYAYVYLHPTDDSGATVYTVTIPVLGRPNRTEETPTPHEQSVIEQAISALNDAVEATAADVETTTANAQAAAQSEANAATSERAAAASAGAALASQNAAHASETASAQSAQSASGSAEQASQSAQASAASADTAQGAAASAERSEQNASASAASAQSKANEAASSAATASGKATESAQSAQSAASSAQNAASSAQSAESSATDAATAKTDAQDAQAAAEQAQAAAEQAKDDAESAADRAEQAEQEVLSAMDGTYENLTSGNAQQLLSTVTESDSVPYLFRQTAKNADRAYLDEVVGGTVAWNQMIEHGNFDSPQYWYTYQCSIDAADSVATVTPSARSSRIYGLANIVLNRKYLMVADFKGTSGEGNAMLSWYGGANLFVPFSGSWQKLSLLLNNTFQTASNWQLHYGSTSNYNNAPYQIRNAQCFDLTAMFGTTIADYIYNLETASAGAGVAYFRKLFPNDYYEYNSGELLSVEGVSAKRTVGFNLWDDAADSIGKSIAADGSLQNSINYCVSDYIRVLPKTTYYLKNVAPSANARTIFCYGYDKSPITDVGLSGAQSVPASGLVTTVDGTHFVRIVRFASTTEYGINLSDPVRNGTYEPYTKRTYPLDSSLTLHGIPKLDASGNLYYDGDTYAADGTVTRRFKKIVLDGVNQFFTASWGSATNGYAVYKTVADIDSNGRPLVLTNKFVNSNLGYNQMPEWSVGGNNGAATTVTFLFPSTITSTAEANNWLKNNNVTMIYPVATPTTETATPYRHLQICDPNGTEEFVSTGIVPVGHNTRYPENLRAKIEGLPWNFNSIIAMTETTTTASKAYSVGDYFILNNVLYRVTSAIASGGTITIGTNCRATTIMDEIKALS